MAGKGEMCCNFLDKVTHTSMERSKSSLISKTRNPLFLLSYYRQIGQKLHTVLVTRYPIILVLLPDHGVTPNKGVLESGSWQ